MKTSSCHNIVEAKKKKNNGDEDSRSEEEENDVVYMMGEDKQGSQISHESQGRFELVTSV